MAIEFYAKMRGPQIGYEREYTDEDWKYGHDSFLTFSDNMRKHDAIYVGEWGGGGFNNYCCGNKASTTPIIVWYSSTNSMSHAFLVMANQALTSSWHSTT